ncbi:peptidylprolyl isomerase [bacterium]|nr:peptidylprolyl isomerase [bacterium]
MRKALILLACISAILFILAGCGGGTVAVVNKEKITRKELQEEAEKLAGKDALAKLIRERLILQAAKKEGVYPSKEEVEKELDFAKREYPSLLEELKKQGLTLEDYKKEVLVSLAEVKLITKGIEISDKEIEDEFNKNKSSLDRVRLRWIVNGKEEEIKKAKEKLASGAFFEVVAKDSSQDVYTKDKGGDLGYVSIAQLRQLSPKLAELALSLPLGKTSDIIKLPNGYALIRVEDRHLATLDSWRDYLKRRIALKKANEQGKPEKVMKSLMDEAKIDIKDSKYKEVMKDLLPSTPPLSISP